ncbi:alpha/beta fold hydrolase [Parachryseolinea silvisoli]|uniref:alpha/beta fold hydrolase n=1 Tax=Parachryseolinea silvisoli TaxID=2873601 RepID=UPI002265CA04|nr:alpha/beta fold hydrolase [Parachryseolinea silvisoli]MCD9017741.1 alpha/beta fold hydrolase [Parachryseolinea silvisoli]
MIRPSTNSVPTRWYTLLSGITILFLLATLTTCVWGQGVQVEKRKGTTTAPYGYYEYLPVGYDTDATKKWPVLLVLHGQGELGNGTTELYKAVVNGPGKEIKKGRHFPMVVLSPQSLYWWGAPTIDQFVEYVKKTYRIDTDRFYLTGLSMGGIVAWEYTAKYPDKIAALVAIAGNGNAQDPCQLAKVPIWAFHGDADKTVDKYGSINIVAAVNKCTSPVANPQAKLTMYPGVGHDSWTRTYDGSAGHDIYTWMLGFSKTGAANAPPIVNAGVDKTLQLPTNQIIITGTASDPEGGAITYAWTKTTGPAATLANATTASLTASALVAGTYVFTLTATDNLGNIATDQMSLVVNPAAVNAPPVVNAGADQIITLPQSSTIVTGTASDDGTISQYLWSQVSGPSSTISDTQLPQITVSGLSQPGVYVYRLVATDDKGATGLDEMQITVNAAQVNQKPVVTLGADISITLPQNTVVIPSAATDTDGTIEGYLWTKISGPSWTPVNETTPELTAKDLVAGIYVFRLTARDNIGEEGYDEIKVTVLDAVNQTPIASAGADKTVVLPTNTSSLIGSGNDPDGGIVTYQWTKVSGPDADLVNATNAHATVNNLVEGVYVFSLTVTDDKGASAIDEMTLTVQADGVNQPPTVSAGDNVNVILPQAAVALTATANDPDGTIQSYQWIKVSGGAITFTGATTNQIGVTDLVAGTFRFRVTVTDDDGATAFDDVDLIVSPPTINNAPVVTASANVTLTLPVNSTVLTAAANDPDGTIAGYEWMKVSGPTAGTLEGAETSALTLSDLVQGTYIFRITVTDDGGATASDEVTVEVRPSGTQTCNCDHVIEAKTEYIKAMDMPKPVKPGDVVCVRAGNRGYIRFMDFVGTADKPITFINCGGQVVINNPLVDGSLSFTRCKYFRVTGTGDPNFFYGFKIAVSTKNTAMFMSDSDFEVDHIEIANSGYAGIMCKIDPTCDNPQYHRGNFVMENIKLHDNYIHDTNGEAYYVGYYAYGGIDKSPCGKVYPHDIKNIKIYNNIIRNTAADGLQVTCAVEGCEIYNNSIENYGLNPFSVDQNNGIIIGGGTSGLCYNNYIRKGTGVGMAVFGLGGNIIFNNIITETGSYGVYFGIGSTIPGRGFNFINNTVMNTKLDGIRYENQVAKGSKFYNNLIINPGTYDIYEKADFCAKGKDSFFYSNCSIGMDYDSANFFFVRNIASVKFVNPTNYDFHLLSNSPVIDAGRDVSAYNVNFDHFMLTRPSGLKYDIGATEYQSNGSTNKIPIITMPANQTLTLPTNSTTLTASAVDQDGTIAGYSWIQVSGPTDAQLANVTTKTLTASSLAEGEYVFRLTVKDNEDASAFADVKVIVKALAANKPPTVNAGTYPAITLPTNTIVLKGIASDEDGTIVKYAWTKVSGPVAIGSNLDKASATFSGLVAGIYKFRLTVTDDDGATAFAEASLTVQSAVVNKAPVANAGGNREITLPINGLTLNGSGSDADGTITKYAWSQQGGPSTITLTTTDQPNLTMTGLVAGVYTFRLTVTDNANASAFADVLVTVHMADAPKPPVVSAGNDQELSLPTNTVTLTGTASGETTLTYLWTKRSGPNATLANATTPTLQLTELAQGTYVFRLTVRDENSLSAFDDVTVTVLPEAINMSPVADAGGNQAIKLPTTSVTLSGTGSDADGNVVNFLWSQLTGLPVSITEKVPSKGDVVVVEGLDAGTYTFRLTVTDNDGATDTDDVTVTVGTVTANLPPIADAGDDVTQYLPDNTVTLHSAGTDADGTVKEYAWEIISTPSPLDPPPAPSPTPIDFVLEDLTAGTYEFRLTVEDDKNAKATDNVTVIILPETVNQAPQATVGEDISVRLPIAQVVIEGSGTDPDGQIVSYQWTVTEGEGIVLNNADTPTLTVTNLLAGEYTFMLTVTDDDGETATAQMELIVGPERTGPEAFAGADTVVSMPVDVVKLVGFGSVAEGAITEYMWVKTSGPDVVLENYNTPELDLTGVHPGEYTFTFTVTDDQGASASDDVFVVVTESLGAPKVFTPNGDGQNDVWAVKNVALVNGCPLTIYDKLGNKVYESISYGNEWDGQYKGRKLEPGPYYYVFKCDGANVFTGGVRLIR